MSFRGDFCKTFGTRPTRRRHSARWPRPNRFVPDSKPAKSLSPGTKTHIAVARQIWTDEEEHVPRREAARTRGAPHRSSARVRHEELGGSGDFGAASESESDQLRIDQVRAGADKAMRRAEKQRVLEFEMSFSAPYHCAIQQPQLSPISYGSLKL